MCLPNAFPHKRYRLGLSFPYHINASLFLVVHLHCLRVHHLLCVSSTTAEGCLSRTPYPSSPNFRPFAQYRTSLALLRVDITNPLSIWASPMHCQQHIVVSGHALVKFLNLQVIGSFDDRKVHYFFYVCVHNKLALAILGFQSFPGYLVANFTRLQVCYLCSYVWIDHFKQIAKFFFCADRFGVDLCDKHVLESHPWQAII